MKRRHFYRYMALSSACFTGIVSLDSASGRNLNLPQAKSHHEWVILYWMLYDNDLVRFGEPIVEMLTRGTQNSETAVVVQSDYWGEPKMRRRQIVNGKIHEMDVAEEDSSDVSTFSAYLDWADRTFEAEHWVIIIVGHGGKINEVSPDSHGENRRKQTWMKVDRFADAVNHFNRATDGRVELLFFQNCNKATLEVVYEARNCARYTLASQLTLGAPNYYYDGFLDRLKDPSIGGRDAAIAIMDSETKPMYNTLTLVDNQAVKQIPEKLALVIQPILDRRLQNVNLPALSTYYYAGEQHCDLLVFLSYLFRLGGHGENEFFEFTEFLRTSVIAHYKTGGELNKTGEELSLSRIESERPSEKFCGLSVYLPESDRDISRYSSLALYRDVDLLGLYRKIVSLRSPDAS